ncbi:uncharacterized protein LMH87_008025 [Akanthomyces muscarius]|uniref:Uncharacterized protein n=1 Tax=Akanthomyces muscarius TaxID=2231603 RepID=A0A9W8QIU8_AKAMU|nr:uncharacterized protein LMH87_008025 [Akanthomyces muscarius]KAJ4159109.1 hypothetical protein LMH87_008025 [Akanthomyces muscarius]
MMRRSLPRAIPKRAQLSNATRRTRTPFPAALRAITTTSVMSAPTNPYASAPADAFQLLPESQKAGEAEDALYDAQIKEVEAWWASLSIPSVPLTRSR